MKCACGNDLFYGHQIIRTDVIVDANGNFHSDVTEKLEQAVYDSDKPYGPFTCTKCKKVYDELCV